MGPPSHSATTITTIIDEVKELLKLLEVKMDGEAVRTKIKDRHAQVNRFLKQLQSGIPGPKSLRLAELVFEDFVDIPGNLSKQSIHLAALVNLTLGK